MEDKMIKVTLDGQEMTAVPGTKICELMGRANNRAGQLPALGAIANRRLTGLYRQLTADADIQILAYNTKQGAFIYRRSLCLLFLAVAKEFYPDVVCEIGQSLGQAYFIEMNGLRVSPKAAERIQARMEEVVEQDVPYVIESVFVDQAADDFEEMGASSKVRFLNQFPFSELKTVTCLGFKDILRGPVAMSTGVLKNFRVQKFRHGLLLCFPNRDGSPQKEIRDDNHKLLFDAFMETREWNELVGVANISDLNEACIHGTVSDLIKVAESLHEKKIAQIADLVTHRKHLPRLIMVAGPSSSGKTTFSRRLGVHLRVNGVRPVALSMDNYYVDRKKTPKHLDGSYDFESVYAIDLPLFNDHLARIIAGEKVETPIFSFTVGKRESKKTIPMRLGSRDMLIIEGIHALNPILHESVKAEDKFGIFVSALTQLCIDEHNRIFTSDSRLIRRIVRDRLYRGYSVAETINGWLSVRAGEEQNIFPFQDEADVMFNSALVYEQAVLLPYAKRFLLEVSRDEPAFTEASRLYKFLDDFIPILPEEVPPTSVLREFIGGSTFQY